MGAKAGFALKSVQWLIRGIQLACAAVVLGIFSYFLAVMHNHDLHIPTSLRAVEGISGAAVLYTLVGLIFLCCIAGVLFASGIAILLDLAFAGAFIYVAYENRHGANSCSGIVNGPFGRGPANAKPMGADGFTSLPKFKTACRLQTAALAVSIAAIIFFLLSILMEFALVRHHRKEKRYGPGPDNDYTSGYGKRGARRGAKRGAQGGLIGGLFSRFGRRKGNSSSNDETNNLPEHTHPGQLEDNRQSYGTESTAVNQDGAHHARGASGEHVKPETGYGYTGDADAAQPNDAGHGFGGNYSQPLGTNYNPVGTAAQQHAPVVPQPANYRYEDYVYER